MVDYDRATWRMGMVMYVRDLTPEYLASELLYVDPTICEAFLAGLSGWEHDIELRFVNSTQEGYGAIITLGVLDDRPQQVRLKVEPSSYEGQYYPGYVYVTIDGLTDAFFLLFESIRDIEGARGTLAALRESYASPVSVTQLAVEMANCLQHIYNGFRQAKRRRKRGSTPSQPPFPPPDLWAGF